MNNQVINKAKKYNIKSYDLLTEWKEKYNAKENERMCQYRNYQQIQNENSDKIKQLKEKNVSLRQLISNKTQKTNKNHLKFILNIKKWPFNKADNSNLLEKIDYDKTKELVSENVFRDIDKCNLLFYERKELVKKLIGIKREKERLQNDIEIVRKDGKIMTVERQVRENENSYEKVKIKFETASYLNKILNEIKEQFIDCLTKESKEIEALRVQLADRIEQIQKSKIELKDNYGKREEIKLQVSVLDKELIARKQKRDEYTTIIQEKLEEAKTIEIDQSKIKSEKEEKNLRHTLTTGSKADKESMRKDELKFKLLNFYYDNYLKFKVISTSPTSASSDHTEIEKLNQRRALLLNIISGLFAQKCALEDELELIKTDYFKCLCLNGNLSDKGAELIKDFHEQNIVLSDDVGELSSSKTNRDVHLNKIITSLANLCAKMLNFKTLNEIVVKSDTLGVYPGLKLSTDSSNLLDIANSLFPKIPESVADQLKVIVNVSAILSEHKSTQASIEPHYYVNELTKLTNFMQNAYVLAIQEDDAKSNEFEKDVYSFDTFNEYVSREKIKIRSQDILNRKLKTRKSIKMLTRMENLKNSTLTR